MRISAVVTRTIRGRAIDYLELEQPEHDLHVSVPMPSAETIGIRAVMTRDQVDEVIAVLHGDSLPPESGWSRRIKDYGMRLQTGLATERAVVMREILRHSGHNASGTAERELLRSAREVLSSELSVALGIPEDEAGAMLEDAAMDGHEVPVPRPRSHRRTAPTAA
ncbi:CarD family transcriptional regulator [Cellulomonas palmilytica]|uniref:CarD family transcriptional regulator n=1 Tax=Cellulomonas palmilytica TaxID=2608402 RepID=UPI001F48BEE7|nr:CarD family transcriptional regulator [Cellulomonas palmilytica]